MKYHILVLMFLLGLVPASASAKVITSKPTDTVLILSNAKS